MANQTFPIETISKLLDLSPRRVQQLVGEGVIPRADRGRYELVPCVQGYIRYLRAQAINADVGSFEGEHKRRLLKARADIATMEAERLAGDLVEVGEVEKTWGGLMAFLRQRFLSLATDVELLCASATTPEQVHEIIETHVHAILAETAAAEIDGLPEAEVGRKRSAEDAGAAAEAEDLGMGGSLSEALQ